jgi:hypothetical protein
MTAIVVPVLPTAGAESRRVARGGLASGESPSFNSASQTLEAVTLDGKSLAQTVEAVQAMALEVNARTQGKSVSLSEVQLEVGVSATGKVGILGIGADLQCAAKLQLKFKIEP